MSTKSSKQPSIDVLLRLVSTRTVMFQQAAADEMGLNMTDHKCLDIATLCDKNLTAGELAELSGLTTGAVTGVIDRLESAGLVKRERDQDDRRRVILSLTHGRDQQMQAVYMPLKRDMRKLWAEFSPAEQAIIARFITQASDITYKQTVKLQQKQ